MTLDEHCARFYLARVQGRGRTDTAVSQSKAALVKDSGLQAAAQQRLREIDNDDLCDRDFCARIYRDFLRQLLA